MRMDGGSGEQCAAGGASSECRVGGGGGHLEAPQKASWRGAAVTCPAFARPRQTVWRWKVTQAVCQALRGKKDFPVLGAGPEPSETPTCRSGVYTFLAEGRLCQATYEGEWCRGRPHGK